MKRGTNGPLVYPSESTQSSDTPDKQTHFNYKFHNESLNFFSWSFMFILRYYERSVKGLWKSLLLVTYGYQGNYIERD